MAGELAEVIPLYPQNEIPAVLQRIDEQWQLPSSTEFGDDVFRRYLDEAGVHPILKREDEIELAQLIEAGNTAKSRLEEENVSSRDRQELEAAVEYGAEAYQRFVGCNLRLVVSIAKKYRGSHMKLSDIVQEGNLGLMHAVNKFDWRMGFKFSTYASWWIKQSISRGIRSQDSTVRIPVHTHDTIYQIQKEVEEHGRQLSAEELAEILGEKPSKIQRVLEADRMQRVTSLDQIVSNGSDVTESTYYSLIEAKPSEAEDPEAIADYITRHEAIDHALAQLSDLERRVVIEHYGLASGEGRTHAEIAAELGKSEQYIVTLNKRAKDRLRYLLSDIEDLR